MIDVAAVRAMFPALAEPLVDFASAADRRIARQSFERIHDYLVNVHANVGFRTARSRATGDALEAFAGALKKLERSPRRRARSCRDRRNGGVDDGGAIAWTT